MVARQRRPAAAAPSGDAPPRPHKASRRGGVFSWPRLVLLAALMAVTAAVGFVVYSKQKPNSVLTKLPAIKWPVAVNETHWGSYRAHTYFGLRTRHSKSPLFGMMWYEQPEGQYMPRLRHWCDQGDGIPSYAWTEADGRTFGKQVINDTSALISTQWLAKDGTWTARVEVKPKTRSAQPNRKTRPPPRHNVIFYLASQDKTEFKSDHLSITGRSPVLGDFTLRITPEEGKEDSIQISALLSTEAPLSKLNDVLFHNTAMMQDEEKRIWFVLNERDRPSSGRFAAVQLGLPEGAIVDITFEPQGQDALQGDLFEHTLWKRHQEWSKRFEAAFQLDGKGYTKEETKMAKVALSNMIGSIGYSHGWNRVELKGREGVVGYGPHSLFSASPSRPFFPRGFLWDEGFHQMLIRRFDPELSLEMVVSWLNTMNEEGWMPREMALGEEAESKVPSEFLTQYPDVANPPSLFYVVEKVLDDTRVNEKFASTLRGMYPKLARWFYWLAKSQKGAERGTFRWRGRNGSMETELNPKTLASGLDDYPRASHPGREERHLDLRCWMSLTSRVMQRLTDAYGTEAEKKKLSSLIASEGLDSFDELVRLHWSDEAGAFADYGRHSERVQLKTKRLPDGSEEWKRVVLSPPSMQFVSDVFGYNSLFPLMLRLIPADSQYLKKTLDRVADPEDMWSPFGLRSTGKKSAYYLARNTPHDAPYWRGYIWMNANYMVLSSLRYYSQQPGPQQERCAKMFEQLRNNLVKNLAKQFTRTGFLWENYDDVTGEGRGAHPFTGWTSLILMIMSDNLDN